MTTIAFASCMYSRVHFADRTQPVWTHVSAHKPDWLFLCGDNIYMDYFGSLYEPKNWSAAKFASEMQVRYSAQFAVKSFRSLLASIPQGQVLGVWDDHDFAWNNCWGTETTFGMPLKKKIATAFFHHYFATLNLRPLPATLPQLDLTDLANLPRSNDPTYQAQRVGPFRALFCDVRSYREDNTSGTTTSSLLGAEQEKWLLDNLASDNGPFLIVSGSTMTKGDDQSWDAFKDFYHNRFLPSVRDKTVLFIGGDVHENRLPPQQDDEPIELVSSAAVLDPPFDKKNFGLIQVTATGTNMFLYKHNKVQYTGRVNFKSGAFKTNMYARNRVASPKATVKRASAQRKSALRQLSATR